MLKDEKNGIGSVKSENTAGNESEDEEIEEELIEDEHESEQFAHDFLETKELIRFG